MSIDGTKLLFEGFLQKRKDTLKMRWSTYWFRLQNTTLFFYTKKNGSAVQSVREVQRTDSKRFMFEITMTNGKRKMLAAETAALRKEWVGHLWQAMNLSTSRISESSSTRIKERETERERDRFHSGAPICSHSDSVMESLPARPLSAPAPPVHSHCEAESATPPVSQSEELSSEEPTYENTLLACNYQQQIGDSLNDHQWSSGLSNAEDTQEGHYDVLPLRNKICEIVSAEVDEGVYDVPLSYRRSAEHQDLTESIYDVPSSLLRETSHHTIEEQPEEGVYWRI
ncbi:uncharacterized protein LOC108880389 isoform X2 [Lates calcarifer]|uniref:Uncharacterized protein LOC108880389 isoform X2 n=1 Tax=Lates calcarifer TaxID=8187 RepID=A0AAJ8BCQ9_LATCA|nr:uncharacterized protein LOC108880389 isoform X2 [Lates calcarifer]